MANKNVVNLEQLRQITGESIFQEIVYELGGNSIGIPLKAEHFNKHKRNESIKLDSYAGMDYEELASKYDLSVSRIHKIIESRSYIKPTWSLKSV